MIKNQIAIHLSLAVLSCTAMLASPVVSHSSASFEVSAKYSALLNTQNLSDKRDFFCSKTRKEMESCATVHIWQLLV